MSIFASEDEEEENTAIHRSIHVKSRSACLSTREVLMEPSLESCCCSFGPQKAIFIKTSKDYKFFGDAFSCLKNVGFFWWASSEEVAASWQAKNSSSIIIIILLPCYGMSEYLFSLPQ